MNEQSKERQRKKRRGNEKFDIAPAQKNNGGGRE